MPIGHKEDPGHEAFQKAESERGKWFPSAPIRCHLLVASRHRKGLMAREWAEEEFMADPKKCANPACSCTAENKEKYCSAHCEGVAKSIEVVCKCGHDHCGGNVTRT